MRRLLGPLLALLAIAVGQWAFPPWFGIDTQSAGRRHASLGHHARWAPPSPERVCAAILERQLRSGDPDRIACPPPPGRGQDLQARVNVVRALAESSVLALAGLGWLAARRRWAGRGGA